MIMKLRRPTITADQVPTTITFAIFGILILVNFLFSGIYTTIVSTTMFVVTFFIFGLFTTPMFFLVALIEALLEHFNINGKKLIKLTMMMALPITYFVQLNFIKDYEFSNLPMWLNFEGAHFIVPVILIIISWAIAYYKNSQQNHLPTDTSSIYVFGHLYFLNIWFTGVLYAPYLFDTF